MPAGSHAFLKAALRDFREIYRHVQASARRLTQQNCGPVAIRDGSDDGESEAGAAFLRAGPSIKAIEHPLTVFGRNTGAIVDDFEDGGVGGRPGSYLD